MTAPKPRRQAGKAGSSFLFLFSRYRKSLRQAGFFMCSVRQGEVNSPLLLSALSANPNNLSSSGKYLLFRNPLSSTIKTKD
jgi:hypothetical protein